MTDDDKELTYYRAVEDLFAELRGAPHTLSPKDFQLLRTWWREGVPMAAVVSGVTEVFAKRRDRGEEDPVVSLSYCRHAVRRHAKHLAEMHVGAAALQDAHPAAEIRRLDGLLAESAAAHQEARPRVAEAIEGIRRQLAAAEELPPSEADGLLFSLESALLEGCYRALDDAERQEIDADAGRAAGKTDGEAASRIRRAHRDRQLRRRLGLPRMT